MKKCCLFVMLLYTSISCVENQEVEISDKILKDQDFVQLIATSNARYWIGSINFKGGNEVISNLDDIEQQLFNSLNKRYYDFHNGAQAALNNKSSDTYLDFANNLSIEFKKLVNNLNLNTGKSMDMSAPGPCNGHCTIYEEANAYSCFAGCGYAAAYCRNSGGNNCDLMESYCRNQCCSNFC